MPHIKFHGTLGYAYTKVHVHPHPALQNIGPSEPSFPNSKTFPALSSFSYTCVRPLWVIQPHSVPSAAEVPDSRAPTRG